MTLFSVRKALKSTTALTAVSLVLITVSPAARANPLDGQVVAGNATITTPSSGTVVVNQHSQNVVLEWGSFNINPGETTRFEQPNAASWALNRVVGSQDPSVIAGTLSANGNIAIVNPDGIVFSQGSRVDVNGLVATTADIDNDAFMRGNLSFNLPGNPAASVINEGNISIRDHGLAAFVAPGVRNSGAITARLGTVSLASGNTFSLDLYGDGLVSLAIGDEITEEAIDVATGQPMADLVKNEGTISANGGTVALTAATARTAVNSVINNTGVIEANTVGMRNGKIILGAQTAASRPATAPRQTVRVSGRVTAAAVTTSIRPAARPGTGGTIQITGEDIQVAGATIDASGANGGGKVLIGGDYLGGGMISDLFPFGEEVREDYEVATAATVTVDTDSMINASATQDGDGGKIILWSDDGTITSADIEATGAGDGSGGFIETSSAGVLSLPEGYVTAGVDGWWLLDPRFITVGTSDFEDGENKFVSAATVAASLNAGTNVQLAATGTNAELAVYSDILKTSGGDAQLVLMSTGSVLIAADILSTSGKLDVGISAADVYDSNDASGQLLSIPSGRFQLNGGHTINTNGGRFGFRGAQFQAVNATEFLIGEDPAIVPPGRIVTEGGKITFVLPPNSVSGAGFAGFFGCDGSSTGCGFGTSFVLDAASGQVGFALNTNYTPTGTSDLPTVFVGDQGIRTTGELLVNNVIMKSSRPTNRNGIHNVEFGTLTLRNDGEMDFPFSDVPGLEAALAAQNNEAPQPVADVTLSDFEFEVGEQVRYFLPQLFTDDGAIGALRIEAVSLPAGIQLERLGVDFYGLSGTFLGAPGTYQIVLRATDEQGATSEITLSVTFDAPVITPPVDTPPIAFPGTVSLPNAEVGTEYNQTTQVLFSDDQAVSGLTLTTSGLPAGLTATANNDGTVTISGTPTTSGAVAFSVMATDAGGNIAAINVNLTVDTATLPPPVDNPPANTGNATTLVNAVAGSAYSATTAVLFSDDNGVGGLSLAVSGLPAGLSAVDNGNGTVTISGTPTTSGAINFTVTATDGAGQTAATTVALTVNNPVIQPPVDNPPTVIGNNTALPNATVGTSYSVTTPVLFADDNGVSGLNLVVTGLPAGLTATNNGNGTVTITGTPTTSGAVTFTVAATDAGSGSVNTSIRFTVNDPIVTPPEPPTNNPPQIVSGAVFEPQNGVWGQRYQYVSAPIIIDENPSGLVIELIGAPEGLVVDINTNGQIVISGIPLPGGSDVSSQSRIDLRVILSDGTNPVNVSVSASFLLTGRSGVNSSCAETGTCGFTTVNDAGIRIRDQMIDASFQGASNEVITKLSFYLPLFVAQSQFKGQTQLFASILSDGLPAFAASPRGTALLTELAVTPTGIASAVGLTIVESIVLGAAENYFPRGKSDPQYVGVKLMMRGAKLGIALGTSGVVGAIIEAGSWTVDDAIEFTKELNAFKETGGLQNLTIQNQATFRIIERVSAILENPNSLSPSQRAELANFAYSEGPKIILTNQSIQNSLLGRITSFLGG